MLGLSLPGIPSPSGLYQSSHGDAADEGTENSPFFSTIYSTSSLLGESHSSRTIGKSHGGVEGGPETPELNECSVSETPEGEPYLGQLTLR